MINLTTSLQIRDWMSVTLYYLNTSPSQDKCSPSGGWWIGSCIHQWNDKEMFLVHICCLHLSHFKIHSYTCSHRSLFAARRHRHRQKHLLSWRRFLLLSCSDKQHQTTVNLWWFCHDETWVYSIFVWRVLIYVIRPCLSFYLYWY